MLDYTKAETFGEYARGVGELLRGNYTEQTKSGTLLRAAICCMGNRTRSCTKSPLLEPDGNVTSVKAF